MKYLRYKGEFVSIGGHVWRAEIWQDADAPYIVAGDLTFDADCPIQIEWDEKAKEEVICGSTATIHIVSPGDRTYQDLYTIEPGSVRLDVYRDDMLYWSGCIDTEFYEEPYESEKQYTVELTFSDFGILKRLKYDMAGMLTIGQILRECILRCDIKHIYLDTSMISTSLDSGGGKMRLDDVKVRSENFYDEDGEASTLYDVTEGMLQPLGLKLIQREGSIYVYDLNGMWHSAASSDIYWSGSSQTMGTDRVYNNAKVTWSTYAQAGNLLPERAWGMTKTDPNLTALEDHVGKKVDDATYYSYHAETDANLWKDSTDSGFTLWTSKQGQNATLAEGSILEGFSGMKFFKIVPQNDGSESEGVVLQWFTYGHEGAVLRAHWHGMSVVELSGGAEYFRKIFETKEVWLPPVERDEAEKLVLNASMELLMDTRFNPFEQAAPLLPGTEDEVGKYDKTEAVCNFVYVPVLIKYTSFATGDVYVWDNRDIVTKEIQDPVTLLWATEGKWMPYSETDGKPDRWGYLAYYDIEDRRNKSGIKGWKKNQPAINPHGERLSSMVSNSGGGQYIPFPSMGMNGGKISVTVMGGLWKIIEDISWEDVRKENNYRLYQEAWGFMSHIMCALPKVEIMNKEMYDKEINTDDVEYSATLNAAAEDGIDIDTICGTSKEGVPTARGAYFRADDGRQITEFSREGRTSQAEDLLTGTLYSQYATRHTLLSGECRVLSGMNVYREANQGGRKFICVSDVQDVRMETSEATFIELSKDEYKNQEGL